MNATLNEITFSVPGVSVTIVGESGAVLFNTATVDALGLPTQRIYEVCHACLGLLPVDDVPRMWVLR